MRCFLFLVLSLFCTSCFQAYNSEEEYKTVPVTNNPYIVPQVPGGAPGASF